MKYLILGGGPAGLTFANKLLSKGEDSFLVIEKEKEAGGLCRSKNIDGAPLDIGGGHFLDVRRKDVCEFLFQFMPQNEWNLFDRDSRIEIDGQLISHPLEANLYQLNMDSQIEYLLSIAKSEGNRGGIMPEKFTDWIRWKLGDKIAENYMIPYNSKLYGEELNELGTYWLEKLPQVSFEETLRSCLSRKALGKQPGHEKFYYPQKYGYGEVWIRMADKIKNNIVYNQRVTTVNFDNHEVVTLQGNRYIADKIIVTIPWRSFQILGSDCEEINYKVGRLKYVGVDVEYVAKTIPTKAQWIYCPDPQKTYHRILVRENFSAGKGYWTETNSERSISEPSEYMYRNEYAYPLNTIEKPDTIKKILNWSAKRKVYGLGRWGEHEHYNSDLVVEKAINLAGLI